MQGIGAHLRQDHDRPAALAIAALGVAYVLDDGRIVFEGPAAEFAKDEERVRALAGVGGDLWTTGEAG